MEYRLYNNYKQLRLRREGKMNSAIDEIISKVTEKILESLDSGNIPWRKPWKNEEYHHNAISGHCYSLFNQYILMFSGYTENAWVTFTQAKEKGFFVKKGSKATCILRPNIRKWKEKDEKGIEKEHVRLTGFSYMNLFNVEQVEGWKKTEEKKEHKEIPSCDEIVFLMKEKPAIRTGSRASYDKNMDIVTMPEKACFDTPEGYYATLFHELAHATGAEKRLNRKTLKEVTFFGTEVYAREELIAETTSAMVCSFAGIANRTIENTQAYCQSWAKRIREDKNIVLECFGQAEKAFKYMIGKEKEE